MEADSKVAMWILCQFQVEFGICCQFHFQIISDDFICTCSANC